ncbi:hypothetical protein C1646_690914 [Rhizophagus diaphanus]|nr:hypothetical protein C1646_690914 [Rhizophagus diaphanus] [Rhizophagus sp. MUCL 43196]
MRCHRVDNKKHAIRVRVTSACKECRNKKTKCEFVRPCTHCRDRNWNCTTELPTKRGPRKNSASVRKKKEIGKEITEVISNVPALAPAPAPSPSHSQSSHSSSICDKNSPSSPSSVSLVSSSLSFSNTPVWSSSPSSGSNSSLPSSPTEEHSFNVKSDDLTFFLAPTELIQNEMPSEVFGREQENIDKLFTEYIKYEDV